MRRPIKENKPEQSRAPAYVKVTSAILIVSTIVLCIFPYTDRKDEMTRSNGITYLMLYALYMAMLFAI